MSQITKIHDGTVASDVETLTGDVGGAVGVDGSHNINILTGTGLTSTGVPGTNTITLTIDGALQQQVYYVGKHGDDANDGKTISRAKLTIQAAVTAASAGDTVLVYPGTYTETVTHTANDLTLRGVGNPNTCIITQADANVIDVNTRTGIFYENFKISCTAATTAINTVQVSTGSVMFRFCRLHMISSAAIVAANQPSIGAVTGTGTLNVAFGRHEYQHTGACGGTAQKGALKVADGGTISIVRCEEINITNSGTALVSALGIDLSTTGVFYFDSNKLDVIDPNAAVVAGFAYVGGTGTTHEFYRNDVHVTATNNIGYGFYSADTATTSRFFYNHIHVTDVAGTSYSYHIGNTSTVISQFDDIVAADGYTLVGGGIFTLASSETDGNISVSGLAQYAPVLGGGASELTALGPLADGELIVGSTGVSPVSTTITAGANITVTNGAGSIDIAATGTASFIWSAVAAGGALAVNNGYLCTGGGALSFSLPATSIVGDTITLALDGAVSWTITQGAGQEIQIANGTTTAGIGGSLVSAAQGDTVTIVCNTADTLWTTISSMGNITVN